MLSLSCTQKSGVWNLVLASQQAISNNVCPKENFPTICALYIFVFNLKLFLMLCIIKSSIKSTYSPAW